MIYINKEEQRIEINDENADLAFVLYGNNYIEITLENGVGFIHGINFIDFDNVTVKVVKIVDSKTINDMSE